MNSASDDSALEQAMIGRWVGASRGQTYDYTFHPKHCFTLTIRSAIKQPEERVFGYWDVRDKSLYMGISESATDAASIEISADSFSILMPGGNRTDFQRQMAQSTIEG